MDWDVILTVGVALYNILLVTKWRNLFGIHPLIDAFLSTWDMLVAAISYNWGVASYVMVPILITGASICLALAMFRYVQLPAFGIGLASWFLFAFIAFLCDFDDVIAMIEDFNLIHAILVTIVIVAVAIAAHLYVAIQDATRTYDGGRSRRRWP